MGTALGTSPAAFAIGQERAEAAKRRLHVYIDSLDIACAVCGATYTAREQHDCPGHDLWAERQAVSA